MRTKFVAGNWKMNKTVEEARALVSLIGKDLNNLTNVEIVLCPPAMSIVAVANLVGGTKIGVGAQNLHWEPKGAFTGEISAEMIREFCGYVIIGHSERRTYFHETDQSVSKKVKAALQAGLIPIVCVGETLEENQSGKTSAVVRSQVMNGLNTISSDEASQIIIAYEPVWAIGTGLASSPEDAQNVHKNIIRKALSELFGEQTAEKIRILYGGSVTAANAAEFFNQPDIDGALVGGASLKAEFVEIAKAAS
ncbi:MAG TPA: triose-phosphate isomerase [Anaerolineales bacterium]|nr:triose-phosphate isomerase [Anaerolineales bacterium]